MKHQLPVRQVPCDEPFERLRLCRICRLSEKVEGARHCSRVVTASPAMHALLGKAAVVAATNSTVLVTGETGSGKEVLAPTSACTGTKAWRASRTRDSKTSRPSRRRSSVAGGGLGAC